MHTSGAEQIDALRSERDGGQVSLVESTDFAEVSYIMLNMSKPPFDNLNARLAAAYSLDRDTYNKVRNLDLFTMASGPFANGETGYLEDAGFPEYDLDKAKDYVAKYKAETGQDLEFTALSTSDPSTVKSAQFIQEQAQKAGMKVTLRQTDQAALIVEGVGGFVSNTYVIFTTDHGTPGRNPPLAIADRILRGGLSGVVFAADVPLVSRVTQGCHPLPGSRRRRVTAAVNHLISRLDEDRAFDALLQDAGVVERVTAQDSGRRAREALAQLKALGGRGSLFVGIEAEQGETRRARGDDYLVRPVVGVDPERGVVAVGMPIEPGRTVRFCVRDEVAARKDLTRVCAEIRDHLHEESERRHRPVSAKGAIYVSCVGRGTHLFGGTGEELRLIAQQLGDVPLVGFYANGEISGRSLYGYTGVLTVFSRGA